jgi:hypothetical protein
MYCAACVTLLCGMPGRYKLIQAFCWSGWRDYTVFSVLSGSVVAGTVRLKWWGGGPSFSAFSSLLSVFLAVGCLR